MVLFSSGVIDVAVHPSGKMAMTIGKDRKLITWNLIKGRSAFVTNIKEIADFVKWSPDGSYYIIGFYKHVDVYSVNSATIEFSVKLFGRSNDVIFLDNNTFAVAGEMSQIEVYSLVSKELVHKFEAHEKRVRVMSMVDDLLITASNDGKVKVWTMSRNDDAFEFTEKLELNTKCRITSMVVHKVPPVKQTDLKLDAEEVEAIAKAAAKKHNKRSVGFSSEVSDKTLDNEPEAKAQKLVVEVEEDDQKEVKKRKNKKKKKKNLAQAVEVE